MEKKKIRVGITHGDLSGIGYEVILKTFGEPAMCDMCIPIVYGSPKAATFHRKTLDLQTNFTLVNSAAEAQEGRLNMISVFDEEVKIDFGVPSEESGKAALLSLQRAVEDIKKGEIDVIVTAPINKATIQGDGFHFVGHTEYLEEKLGDGNEALMILMNHVLRVALVTTHVPVKDIAANLSKEKIQKKIEIFNKSLKQDFTLSIPRIAVLALNPHCGDGGLLGDEEETEIKPAIEAAREEGIQCFGPYAADGFFGAAQYDHFDGVLAMYHDQGLAAFKTLAGEDGVNYTANLPFVRTSPDHGTAYDIAGKGKADETSFRESVYAAMDIFINRQRDREAYANPLEIVAHSFNERGGRRDETINLI